MNSEGKGPGITGLPAIERLIGRENWHTWRFAVRTYLEVEDLWEAIEPGRDEAGREKVVDAVKDRKARGKVILSFDPTLYVHVQDTRTAREAWRKLEQVFEDNGLTRKWGLLHKLITTSLAGSESMEAYVNRMVGTAHQLNSVGFVLNEEWLGMLLLAGLPESYRPMVMALENSGAMITGDIVKTKLLQELQPPSIEAGPAFVSKGSSSQNRKQSHNQPWNQQFKGPQCRRCHDYGHIARDCVSKETTKKNFKGNDAFCTVLSAVEGESEDWFFDSGSCRHLTRNKALLEYKTKAEGSIYAANKGRMNVVAEGTVVLHPKENAKGKPIDVNEVQLIPELAANLLSVSKIVDRGHTVTFTKNGCTVVNSDDETIATGSRWNGLFKLEQKSAQALACQPLNKIELWHKRTGHLSIKG